MKEPVPNNTPGFKDNLTLGSTPRSEVIENSSRLSTVLPNAVLMGDVALMTLYEARMKKPMFESYKGNYYVYLPPADLLRTDRQAPAGYRVDQDTRVHKPSERYIVLHDEKGNSIGLFGRDESRQYEDIVLDGKKIRVLTLGEQIADKLDLYIARMGRLNPNDREKHRLYASKLQELADTVGNEQEITQAWERMQKRNEGDRRYDQDWKTLLTWLVDIGWKEKASPVSQPTQIAEPSREPRRDAEPTTETPEEKYRRELAEVDKDKKAQLYQKHPNLAPTQPSTSFFRSRFTRRRFLAGAAGAALGAVLRPVVEPQLTTPTSSPTATSPFSSPTARPTQVSPTAIAHQEAPKAPEKTNILDELLKPFIEEAMRRRAERAKNDPEYARRVDQELNAERVNFLLYGYGDTLENPPENPNLERGEMGSHSIFSYNLRTKKFDIVSLTHDIRAPEIEKYLQKQGREATPTKLNGAFNIGGFALQGEAIENATGFAVDFQMVMPDTFIKDITDNAFGAVNVDVPFSIDLYPFYHEGKLYPEGHLEKGKQKMDGIKAMQFLKAWSKTHRPEHERNIRKHLFIKALIKEAKANKTNLGFLIKSFGFLQEQEAKQTVKVDFDLAKLLASPQTLIGLATKAIGQSDDEEMFQTNKTMYVVDPYSGGPEGGVVWVTRSESPQIKDELARGVINDPTMVVPHTKNANPYSDDLITNYWSSVRKLVKETLSPETPPSPVAISSPVVPEREPLPPGFSSELPIETPVGAVLYPEEITNYNEVRERLERLVGTHTSVITESYYTRDLAALPRQKREQALDTIATAHAKALIEYYGNKHAIIGLDPGHGGSDIGSSGRTPEGKILNEKDLTWEIAQLVGKKIYELSDGQYDVIMLRPENPKDVDLDGDGIISPIERLQKRKALLIATEERLRPNAADRGKNILYLSIHLNGSPDPLQKGSETYFPNKTGEANPLLRTQSKDIATVLQRYLVEGLNAFGVPTMDRGAREDPDQRVPGKNNQDEGPYIATGSRKLLRDLALGQGRV